MPSWSWSCDRRSVGRSVFVSGSHPELRTRFFMPFCGFLDVRHPLWREDRCIIYSYNSFCALSEQSLSGPNATELTTIFYCFIRDSPYLEGQVPVFKSPRYRVVQVFPRALGFLFVASYDSQGCCGGILTRLHASKCHPVEVEVEDVRYCNDALVSLGGVRLCPLGTPSKIWPI
jgi:hypothetical protein